MSHFTTAQLQALKADIAADPVFGQLAHTTDNAIDIANAYKLPASPGYWVFATFIPENEIYDKASVDGTTWDWTTYIAQSATEQNGWSRMIASNNGLRPAFANQRAAFAKIFAGSGAGPQAQRLHLNTISRRLARRFEKVLATATVGGSGTRGSTANPDTPGVDKNGAFIEAVLDAQEILDAWAS